MRWFFEQAFALLLPEYMPKSGLDREYFVTVGICYIAGQQKFIPPINEVHANNLHRSYEKQEYLAAEYCKSRFGFLLSIHEEEDGVIPDLKYSIEYKGRTYEESKHVILTAVYALKLLEDFCRATEKIEWIPTWKIEIPKLKKCSMDDVINLSEAHEKKYRSALILTCMQLAAKMITDNNLVSDKDLAEVFSLTKPEFSALQLRVLDGLKWHLNRTNEQLIDYCERQHLPERVSLCIAEHEDRVNSFQRHAGEPPSSPETKTVEISDFVGSSEHTSVPLRFLKSDSDLGYSKESPTIQTLSVREICRKIVNKKYQWD